MGSKVALVTGGSRGIGKCVVDLLRSKGWEVIAPTRAECDWGQFESVLKYAPEYSNWIDALIFCHGEWFLDENQSGMDWMHQFNSRTNFPAIFLRETSLVLDGASVVFVSSTQAFDGPTNTLPYAAACAAQLRLMRGCAKDKINGARYNAVAPGWTDTDMGKQVKAAGGVSNPNTVPQPPEVVAAEIVRLIESDDNGRVMRVVNSEVSEAKWSW